MTANAATWYASPSGAADATCTAEDPGTIQAAVNKAANGTSWETGDEVVLLAGTYDYSDPVWSGKNCVNVPKNKNYLTIRSASGNPSDTILLGRGGETYVSEDLLTTNEPFSSQAVYLNSKALLKGLTITNFHSSTGGTAAGVSAGGLLHIDHCVIAGNTGASAAVLPALIIDSAFLANSSPGDGAAIYGNGTCLYATNCVFSDNAAANAAVARSIYGTLSKCVFTRNTATGTGGCFSCSRGVVLNLVDCHFATNSAAACGVAQFNTCVITNCTFVGNSASGNCGVWSTYAGSTTAFDSLFRDNTAGGNAGAGDSINAYNCAFIGNRAGGRCGAVGMKTDTVSGCLFSNNWAVGESGAIGPSNNYHPIVTNCLFIGNGSLTASGGVMHGSSQTVYDSVFIDNAATNGAGGATSYGGTYFRCRFERNRASAAGAAASGRYHDCVFTSNSATGNGGAAGDVYAYNCVFERNRAQDTGGAMAGSGNKGAWECVFLGNSATNSGVTIKMPLYNCLVVSNETIGATTPLLQNSFLNNCTFVGNRTGGMAILGNSANNTIFHGNVPFDVSRSYITLKNCLYETVEAPRATFSDCIQTNNPHFNFGHNPKLAWYAPRKRSPAVNAGAEQSWAADSLDLAGNGRLNGPIDIGCYEFWPSTDGTKVLLR